MHDFCTEYMYSDFINLSTQVLFSNHEKLKNEFKIFFLNMSTRDVSFWDKKKNVFYQWESYELQYTELLHLLQALL